MDESGKSFSRIFVVSVFFAAVVFIADLSISLGVAAGVPYVALVLISMWLPQNKPTIIAAIAGTILTILGFFFSPSGGILWMIFINRFLAIFAIWVAAILILARKRAVEKLQERGEKYRTLFNSITDAVLINQPTEDGLPGKFFEVNDIACQRYGYSREELLNLTPSDLRAPETKRHFNTSSERMQKGLVTKRETVQITKNGKEIPVEIYSKMFKFKGKPTVISLARDITERKQTEEALRKSEERYREFVERTDDLITQVDSEGRFTYANHTAEKVFGVSAKKCIGMSAFGFIHPEDRQRTETEFAGWVQNRVRNATFENRHVNKITGETREMLWTINLHYDEKINLTGINGIARDVTDRKKLEAVTLKAEKLESLGILAGGIAHDFNNLLSIMQMNLSLAEEDIKPEVGTSKFLKEVEKESIRAKDLTARLITFSKGGTPVKKVASIVDLVRDTITSTLSGSDIDCEFSIPEDLWPVGIDQGQMKQAIHNIVINAEEAMTGEGTVKVYLENVSIGGKDLPALKDGKYVKISVKDRGVGIPDENLTKIFDPYFSTKEMGAEKGMGLGLSVCHSIVEKHSGLVTVESELGTGTTIFIYLPASDKEIEPLEPVKKTEPERPLTGKGKVLLMDDEKMIRDTSIKVLNRLGYDSEVSKDGTEAIELYEKAKESGEPFDLVILDLNIQFGMGGKEAIEKLLKIDPDVKGIVSSGYSDDPVVTNYRENGFLGVLTKPYTAGELSKTLHDVILGIQNHFEHS